MIEMNHIQPFFPTAIRENKAFHKYMLKEYLQFMILDYLSSSVYAKKLSFIGGTNLRLIHGIDRFSEDIDFDCKDMSREEFMEMTDEVLNFLQRNDYSVETRDVPNPKISAFRRSFYFPGLLFKMNLSGHRDERFLMKIEAQDQGVAYRPDLVDVKRCGFFFPVLAPPLNVLCSMKLSALLTRSKGRDFYDSMFLLSQTEPDYEFLKAKCGIGSLQELKAAINKMLETTDIHKKSRDFEHLLFNPDNAKKILRFGEFLKAL